jgi:hypothetical protein
MMADLDDNEAPEGGWRIPSCGVSRAALLTRHAEPASAYDVGLIATELVHHFDAPRDCIAEIETIILAAAPSVFCLQQIYRHAFHPACLVAIGEGMICPPKTRAKQLADAFSPVIGRARRITWKPPRPRQRSVNPATKDFTKFTNRLGWSLAFHARYSGDYETFDQRLARDKDYRPEHRAAILAAALAAARCNIQVAEHDLTRAREALAWLEAVEDRHE